MRHENITYEAVFECIKNHGPITKTDIVGALAKKNKILHYDGCVGGNPRYFGFESTVCGLISCLSQNKFIKHKPISKSTIRKHPIGVRKWFAVKK